MAILYNRVSQKELKEKITVDPTPRTTVSFYQYFTIKEPIEFRNDLFIRLNKIGVLGRIYIAHEGINAQINVPTENMALFKSILNNITGLSNIRLNIALEENKISFWVLKIKVRNKIVADGIEDDTFDVNKKGRYLKANEVNTMASMPNTILVDMRNHYEYEVGHFKNAIEIPSDTFREQLPMAVEMLKEQKDKNIIMYCTGGIRCEKASAYMLHNGFNNVFHVEGGIIEYTNKVREQGLENNFIGKNFVFDDRLGERITEDVISNCHQCGAPCDTHINCYNEACHLLFIQCKSCAEKYNHTCSNTCKEVLSMPIEQQAELRKGIDKGKMIFNKSKQRLRPTLKNIE
jgi:UPF0176 protein